MNFNVVCFIAIFSLINALILYAIWDCEKQKARVRKIVTDLKKELSNER